MKRILTFLLVLGSTGIWAQLMPQIGAEANGLGGTALNQKDVFSSYNNPGALGQVKKTSVGLAYDNRFLLKELSLQSLAGTYALKKNGTFGIHAQHYGFALYREMVGGLSYGMELAPRFSIGTTVNIHRIQLGENYGNSTKATFALGMLYAVNDDLSFGMRVHNISRSTLASFEDERYPTVFGLGLQYAFSEKVFWNLEAEKNMVYPINIKTGLALQPHEIVALRLGVNSYPFQSTFGLGLTLPKFQFDLAAAWHAQLGISPSFGLIFNVNE